MSLNSVEYIGPGIILVIIFVLKLTVDENFSFENLKKLFLEATVDIISLAISFVVSFLIASASKISSAGSDASQENFVIGIIALIVYIFALIIVVFISKFSVRKYLETEKRRYFVLGIFLGYSISIAFLYYSIDLLRQIGGA